MIIRINDIQNRRQAESLIKQAGVDENSVALMSSKAVFRDLFIEGVDNRAAGIIKQYALSLGAEAAVSRDVSCFKKGASNVVLMATLKQLEKLAGKLKGQPFGLDNLGKELLAAVKNYDTAKYVLETPSGRLRLGAKPVIMGILNVTPDSFSDGGMYSDPGAALERALEMEQEGASIIDIGGESTRPGARQVSWQEETRRILPVLKALRKKAKTYISIDTYKPETAKRCIAEGADIINDITALRYKNGAMAKLLAGKKVPVVLMHMLKNPRQMQKDPRYKDVAGEVYRFLSERAGFAVENGINRDRIVVDPGIGFGKTVEHNLKLLAGLAQFRSLGCPVLIGASNKSFIGVLNKQPDPQERIYGSIASHVAAYISGAMIFRVHDVKGTKEALNIARAVIDQK